MRRSRYTFWLPSLALLLAPAALGQVYQATADAGIFYVYDPVGRLVGVVTPTGDVAQYVYDPAGNITQINRYDGGIQVLGFGPNGAAPGSTITIYGSGFSGGDTVTIGGQSATVDSVSGTSITVTVPTGSPGGTVNVSGGGSSSNSAWSLSVPDSGIAISGFSPDAGDAGSLFTITGTGFDPMAGNDVVVINTTQCAVVDAGPTSLIVAVPSMTGSGHVSVTDTIGTAISCGDFYIPPPGYDVSAIAATARTTIEGSAQTLSSVGAGQAGLLLFDAQAGSVVTIAISSFSGYGSFLLLDPNSQLVGLTLGEPGYPTLAANGSYPTPPLPFTGTYALVLEPEYESATATFQIFADATGILTAGGDAGTYNPAEAGQAGAFQFSGTPGQNLTLAVTSSTFSDPLIVRLYEPRGSLVGTGYSPIFQIPTLLTTGQYTAVLSPVGADTGEASIQVLTDVEGTVAEEGCTVPVFLLPGQYGHYTFTGNAADVLDLAMPGFSTDPASQSVFLVVNPWPDPNLVTPDESIADPWYNAGFTAAGHADPPALPETGTYDLWVEPQTIFSFDGGVQLSLPQADGTLTIGTAATFSASRVGQKGIYTFSGTGGQNLSLALTSPTFPTGVTATIYDPYNLYVSETATSGSNGNAADLIALLIGGTYTVVVEPEAADTGEVTLEVFEDATGTVATDGTPTSVSLAAGQRGEYSFSGTGGSTLGVSVTSLSTTPSSDLVYFTVYEPGGTELVEFTTTTSTSYGLPELPTDGTYTIRVEPYGAASCTVDLALVPPAEGTLSAGTPTTFTCSEVGEEGVYTFSASAGQYFSLLASGATFANDATVAVLGPSGSSIANGYVYSWQDLVLDLTNLPATGTYTVLVDPYGANTGEVTLELFQDATTTIATDGTPASVSLSEGQRAEYTFSGTAGDYVGVGASSLSTTPSGSYVFIYVYEPSGAELTGNEFYTNLGFALPPLPATGTYTLRVEPNGPAAASLSLDVAEPIKGWLHSGGSPKTFSTSIVGQEGAYKFWGNTGDNDTLYVSSITFSDVVVVTAYQPDGYQINSQYFYGPGSMSLSSLPATGAYTIVVSPNQPDTGSLDLQLN